MFGERIKKLRLEKGMTQEDLGKILNKTKNNISQYETGKRQPDFEVIKELAKIFNVSIDYLLGLTDVRETIDELIKKGEVSIKPSSDIGRAYESLTDKEKKMFNDYAKLILDKICAALDISLSNFFKPIDKDCSIKESEIINNINFLKPELKKLIESVKDLSPEQLINLTEFIKSMK